MTVRREVAVSACHQTRLNIGEGDDYAGIVIVEIHIHPLFSAGDDFDFISLNIAGDAKAAVGAVDGRRREIGHESLHLR